ncbi:MAG: tetratricopeptide repeat protein [Thermoplasmata archaeon]|nr:tetratricopeptide repeat protein [Thermoplasmata archaeon]
MLDEDSPEGDWRDRMFVELMYEGKESKPPRDDRLKAIYLIYRDWFSGNKDAATERLIHSQYYLQGDWEFLLVSARISMDEKDYRSARMMYDRILESAPPYVTYEAAEAHLAAHDPIFALELYDRLNQTSLRAMKGRINAYMELSSEKDVLNSIFDYLDNEYVGTEEYRECFNLLMASKNVEDAKKVLDHMSRSNMNDPTYLLCLSKYRLERRDLRGARQIVRKAVRYSKNDISARVLSAEIKLASGELKSAEKECSKVLAEDPQNLEAMVLKRDVLLATGKKSEMLYVCRQILDHRPTDVESIKAMAISLAAQDDPNGAVMALRKALEIDPSRDNTVSVISMMIEFGMYRDAMYVCYDAEKKMPADAMIRRLRGNAEYNLGEYLKASISFSSAAEIDPHDPVLWYSKGMADEARGDLDAAELSFNRAVLLDLNQSEYWIAKAAVQEKFDDLYGAIESLNRAIELDPESVYPMVRKAIIMEKAGRYKEALYFVEMSRVTDPNNANVMILEARLLRELGHYKSAIKKAKEANDAAHTEESVIELANAYTAFGRRSEAFKLIDSAMKEMGSTQALQDALTALEQGLNEVQASAGVQNDTRLIDPEESARVAESLATMGDYKGAVKSIDSALAASGDDLKYVIMKASYLLKLGDKNAANNLINEALKVSPKSAALHEALGDVRMAKSEFRGALQEYEKAMSFGLSISSLLAKKGDAQQGLGYYDKSIDTYTMAVNRDPDNRGLRFKLIEKLYDRNYLSRAESELLKVLEEDPQEVRAIVMLTRVRKDLRKDEGITEAYRMFRECPNASDDATETMIAILEGAGHDEEAKSLKKTVPDQSEDLLVKRTAEKVLRRAYVARVLPTDPDLLSSMGLEGEMADDVVSYVRKKSVFGDIITGTTTFQEMERASNDVVMKLGLKNIESIKEIPLEGVFVIGNYKDADEAKYLIAYMEKALTCQITSDESLKVVLDRVQGISLYDIMKNCKVGIYQARQIRLLLGIKD